MTQTAKTLFVQRLYTEEKVQELKQAVSKASEVLSDREGRNVSMGEIVTNALEQYCANVLSAVKRPPMGRTERRRSFSKS